MANRIDILIAARNQAKGPLAELRGDLQGIDSEAAKLSQGLAAFAGAAGIAALAAGVAKVASSVAELARASAEVQRVGTAFNSLAEQAGSSGSAMLGALQQAAAGTIANKDLMLAANRAILLGVADTASEMEQLLQVASARGKAMGLSTTQAFSDIITGIGRMSPLILDNLGIVTGGEKVFTQYAESIGKTADTLSDAEKKQALLNSVVASSRDIVKANAESGEDLAAKFERMDASIQNAKDALGALFSPAVAAIADQIADAAQAAADQMLRMSEAGTATDASIFIAAGAQAQQSALEGQLNGLLLMRDRLTEGLATAKADLGTAFGDPALVAELEQRLQAANTQINQTNASLQALGNSASGAQLGDLAQSAYGAATALGETGNAAMVAAMEAERLKAAALDGADGLSTLESMAWSTGNALDVMKNKMAAANQIGGQLDSIARGAISSLQSSALRAVQAGGDPKQIAAQFAEAADQIQNMGLNMNNTTEAMFENRLAVQSAAQPYQDVFDTIVDTNREADKLVAKDYRSSVNEAQQAWDSFKGKVSGVLNESLNLSDILGGDTGAAIDKLLPRDDAINEDARRLADVAVKGFDSPWASYLNEKFPDLFKGAFEGGGDIKGEAARILRDFQAGLNPDLLDKDAAKERIKRMLLGEARMADLASEIATELSQELGGKFTPDQIESALADIAHTQAKMKLQPEIDAASLNAAVAAAGPISISVNPDAEALRTAFAAGGPMYIPVAPGNTTDFVAALIPASPVNIPVTPNTDTFARAVAETAPVPISVVPNTDTFAESFKAVAPITVPVTPQLTDADTGAGAGALAGGFVTAIRNMDIGGKVVDTISKQLGAEGNLKILEATGKTDGAAWGRGFLASMEDIGAKALEKLGELVAPYVEAALNKRAQTTGANP